MSQKLLVDTRWSQMILPLFSKDTEQFTSGTGTMNRYDLCLSKQMHPAVIYVEHQFSAWTRSSGNGPPVITPLESRLVWFSLSPLYFLRYFLLLFSQEPSLTHSIKLSFSLLPTETQEALKPPWPTLACLSPSSTAACRRSCCPSATARRPRRRRHLLSPRRPTSSSTIWVWNSNPHLPCP